MVAALDAADTGLGADLVQLLTHRVPPGVDDGAEVKVAYLAAVARQERVSDQLGPGRAVQLLGTMLGGYCVPALVELLDSPSLGGEAAAALGHTLLVFDSFHDVVGMAERGNRHAADVLRSWADADWFTGRPPVPDAVHLTVFRVDGEINTDDLSPATEAWSRADIPLHALSLLANRTDVEDPVDQIASLQSARPAGGLRGRRRRHRIITEELGQLAAVAHRRGHPLRAQQAPGRGRDRIADRPHLRQHRSRTPAPCPSSATYGPSPPGTTSSCDPMPVASSRPAVTCSPSSSTGRSRRSTGCEPVGGYGWSSVGRSPTRPEAPSAGAQPGVRPPPVTLAWIVVHAGPEDRGPGLRRGGRHARDLLRAHRLERRQPGHHRTDEPERARGAGLPRLRCRPGPADLLPHIGLPEGRRHRHPADTPPVHDRPGRRRPPARGRHHPQLAEPDAPPGPGRHRERLPYPVPARHLVPGRLGAGGLRRGRRGDAPGHARIGARPLPRHPSARHHPAGPGPGHPVRGTPTGPPHGGRPGRRQCVRRADHRDRGARGPDRGAGVRALRRHRRTVGGRLHHLLVGGFGELLPPLQRGDAARP